jgi:GTP-binding protein
MHEFHALGLGPIYSIAAVSGSGTGELLDALVPMLPGETRLTEEEENLPRISIVGRPNAGKSSLVNMLLGNERSIVTPIPGTTRDSILARYKSFGLDLMLVDTAGIRKKSKVKENIEFYSVMRAIRSIESSDVCILMVDAERGFEAQDLNIFSLIAKNHKGVVIVVNKWDLVGKETNTMKKYEELIRENTAPFRDVPIIFTSVTEKQRILKAMEMAVKVFKQRSKKIPTSELNEVMLPIIEKNPPPMTKDKRIKVKFVTQLPTRYPSFVFFCNLPQYVKEPYRRFVENQLRERFDFTGVPVEIYFRQK